MGICRRKGKRVTGFFWSIGIVALLVLLVVVLVQAGTRVIAPEQGD